MNDWWLLRSPADDPPVNMAVDEALLLSAPRLARPVLRFYHWRQPAATFGYFQPIAHVESATALRPLIRRPTGGGIVPHDRDWTYAVCIPRGHEWHEVQAVESYRRIHEWIRQALALDGIAAQLAPNPLNAPGGQCFVGYEQFDLLWHGRKIAGAAQRRTRDALLIQGSLQPAADIWNRPAWESAMVAVAAQEQHVHWEHLRLDQPFLELVGRLAREKYSRDTYNRKR